MKSGQILTALIVAALIAGAVSFFIKPKLDAAPTAPTAITAAPVTKPADQAPVPGATRRTARISVRDDGHYWARALVNRKTSVEFMIDTGASVVVLTYRDAQRMGLKPASLDYRWKIRTAGGETMGASVLIDSIKINQVHIRNVEAMVLQSDLEQSLLGMSFLKQLYSYEFRGERLIIRQ